MYKGIVWDLDGTLLDTLDDLTDAVNAALGMHGLPQKTKDEVRKAVGNGIRKLIERTVPAETDEVTTNAVFVSFKEYYKDHMNDKTASYEGITDLLRSLSDRGVRMAVVSNKADFATAELCRIYFGGVIDVAIGQRDGVPKKPSPDAVFTALAELGVTAAEAVFIGDSDVDVLTGMNAGMDVIAVSWGFRTADSLKAAGADRIADTPKTLGEMLLSAR